jgi:CDP-glucose 4,6-dehydratase
MLAARMAEAPAEFSGAWNFGPDNHSFLTVDAMVEHAIREWGTGRIQLDPSSRQHEAAVLRLDSSKARTLLGWRPRWDVRKALTRTVQWHKRLLAGDDMLAVSRAQIAEYADGDIA